MANNKRPRNDSRRLIRALDIPGAVPESIRQVALLPMIGCEELTEHCLKRHSANVEQRCRDYCSQKCQSRMAKVINAMITANFAFPRNRQGQFTATLKHKHFNAPTRDLYLHTPALPAHPMSLFLQMRDATLRPPAPAATFAIRYANLPPIVGMPVQNMFFIQEVHGGPVGFVPTVVSYLPPVMAHMLTANRGLAAPAHAFTAHQLAELICVLCDVFARKPGKPHPPLNLRFRLLAKLMLEKPNEEDQGADEEDLFDHRALEVAAEEGELSARLLPRIDTGKLDWQVQDLTPISVELHQSFTCFGR